MINAGSRFFPAVLAGLVLSVLIHIGSGKVVFAEDEDVYRFAVVNMSIVLQRAPQSAAESKRLEELYADRERALAAKQEEWSNAEETLSRTRATLSRSELVTRESELRTLQRSLKRQREDLREEVRISKDQALDRLQSKVADAIEAIRAKESLDIIFRESDYIVASERVNVTGKVLEYLQQTFEETQSESSKDGTATGE